MQISDSPLSNSPAEPPGEVLDFLDAYSHFYVVGHKEPDGDCLGSQLALGGFLSRRGRQITLLSPGPFSRPEIIDFAPLFHTSLPGNEQRDDAAVILLDCSTPDRTGRLKEEIAGLPLCVIDHHASGTSFGDARWILPSAPSVTYMITLLIRAMNDIPEPDEAKHLFFGLATDTGFFRHLDRSSAASFEIAADLVHWGSSPKDTFRRMYGNRPLESRLLLGRLLERLAQAAGGRLLYTWETLADKRELGEEARDSDMLYQLLLGTRGCEAAAVIREEEPGLCSAGLRSLFDLDVGKVAHDFGGGGHARAAGFSFSGSRDELEKKLLPLLVSRLTNSSDPALD